MADVSFFRECSLCGRNATLVYRWYQHDNGQQDLTSVCPVCADSHASVVKGKK